MTTPTPLPAVAQQQTDADYLSGDESGKLAGATSTPRTDAAEAAWDRNGGGDVRHLFSLLRVIEGDLQGARSVLRDWRNNEWGSKQAWIVNGAPDLNTGIAAAKTITALNVRTDAIL